jgi:acyl carrier protein
LNIAYNGIHFLQEIEKKTMIDQELAQKITSVIGEILAVDSSTVTLDSDLRDDFDASSLDLVQLIWSLEEELGEIIPEEAFDTLKTPQDIIDYINR